MAYDPPDRPHKLCQIYLQLGFGLLTPGGRQAITGGNVSLGWVPKETSSTGLGYLLHRWKLEYGVTLSGLPIYSGWSMASPPAHGTRYRCAHARGTPGFTTTGDPFMESAGMLYN